MELEKFHVFERNAAPPRQRHQIAGEGMRVGGDFENFTESARRQNHRFGVKDMNLPRRDFDRHAAATFAVLDDQVKNLEFVEKCCVVLDILLVQGLQNHMPRAVRRFARTHHGNAFARIVWVGLGMSAKAPLLDLAIGRAVERQAQMFQLDDGDNRFIRENFRRILIHQIIAALDGIVHVPFGMVFFHIAERGGDPALCGAGM